MVEQPYKSFFDPVWLSSAEQMPCNWVQDIINSTLPWTDEDFRPEHASLSPDPKNFKY